MNKYSIFLTKTMKILNSSQLSSGGGARCRKLKGGGARCRYAAVFWR